MNDRLEFATRIEAQAFADKMHANMIAVDPDYAKSVQLGHTTAWAIPYQERDAAGKVIGTLWYVNVKDRGRKAAEPGDLTKLKPFAEKEIVAADVTKIGA